MSENEFANRFENYSPETALSFIHESKPNQEGYTMLNNEFTHKIKVAENNLLRKLKAELHRGGSVYTGSAGVALLYFLYGLRKPDNGNENFLEASKYLNLNKLDYDRASFLCGAAGPLAIAAAISSKLGAQKPKHFPELNTLIKKVIDLQFVAENTETPDELLYGRAGYLYALLFMRKYTTEEAFPPSLITKVANLIIASGKALAKERKARTPLLWQWHGKIYLGAAHGAAGILYMLLVARDYISKDDVETLIVPTLDGLLELSCESGNLPSSLGKPARLVQWCHGAPGFVQLCALAYEVFKDEKYLSAALQCGEVVWTRGLVSKGYSICHGVSGNAYTFLQLYQTTKDPKHLYRACCYANWCIERKSGTQLLDPDRPASLFEGSAGQLYLLRDITDPLNASFPAYGFI